MPGIARLWDYYTDWTQRANKWNPQRRITAIPPKEAGKLVSALSPNACTAVLEQQCWVGPTCRTASCQARCPSSSRSCPAQAHTLPKAGPASSLSKETSAPAACLCAFYSYADDFISTLHALPASYTCTCE